MSYIGLFELDVIDAKPNSLTYGEDLPKYLICFVNGGDIENDKTLADAMDSVLTPILTAIYSGVKNEYLVQKPFEWTLGMFNDCDVVDSTTLCGDFSEKPPVCTYLGNSVGILGTRFDMSADKMLKNIIDMGTPYNLIHSKPIGEDTTEQLKVSLKKPSYSGHIGIIPSWGSEQHTSDKYFNELGSSFDK